MTFNILRNSVIRNDMSCRHDTNAGWGVVWDENDNLKQYTDTSGLTSILAWDRVYVAASTGASCYLGPSVDQTPVDALVYSTIELNMRIESNPQTVIVPTTGKIQFQTDNDPVYDEDKVIEFSISADNAYNQYTIDMSQVRKWNGNVTRLRVYPFINGTAGYIIHIRSLKVKSKTLFACATGFTGTVCNKFSEYSHPCPWVGAGGSSQTAIVDDGITIIANVNDRLVVNINGYGDQSIILSPVNGARLKDVARDVEEKISNVGIGGYAGVRVDVALSRMTITADDTREAASTLHVQDTAAARLLGFYDENGVALYTESKGEAAASRYEPAGTIQLSKAQIAELYRATPDPDDNGIELDIGKYSLRAGREDYALTYKDVKIDFTDKTIIDFNNPINNSGVLTSVAYSGDAYSTTRFRIFRQKADGSITCIFSVSMGVTSTAVDGVFEVPVNVRVRKGDLLGVYDGRIDSGKLEETPNGSYFLYSGNLTVGDTITTAPVLRGRGEAGLRLFAHGSDKQTSVVLNVEFEQQELIEEIVVVAEEEARVEEINLTHARAGGLNGGIFVTATTGVDKFGAQAPAWTSLSSIFDGNVFPGPGVTDARPSWIGTTYAPADKFDQTELTLLLEFAKAVPVFFDVNRVVFYFKDASNVKYFSIEYPITTDDLDTNQYFGFVAEKYNEVYLEGKLLSPSDHPLYFNPLAPNVTSFLDGYQVLEYRKLDIRFDPVKARAIKYLIKNYAYEDDETKSTFSTYAIAPSPRIMEIEVYAQSVPAAAISDNFSFETSTDDSVYYVHDRVRAEGATSARYLIGYPVQYVRAHIEPQGKLVVRSLQITTSEARTRLRTGGALDGTVSLNVSNNDFTSHETVLVKNESNSTYNYFVTIASQRSPSERCILWNKLSSTSTTSLSEIGPSAVVYKRDGYYPREYNYAYNAPAYVVDPFWLMNRNAVSYISNDLGATWSSRGNTLTDYNTSTFLTSRTSTGALFVYILIDLGQVYALDTVQVFGVTGYTSFDAPLYTSKNVDDPSQLNIVSDFTGVKESARWIRLRAFSDPIGTADNLTAAVSYIQASLNPITGTNHGKIPWIAAPRLTNYVMGSTDVGDCGEGWQCAEDNFNNWYTIDLQDHYNVTNIVIGPQAGSFSPSDVDLMNPGDQGSLFSGVGDKTSSSISYSQSNVSDPAKVRWGSLNGQPVGKSRWILVRRASNILDEIIVHVENNSQGAKSAFAEPRWWSSNFNDPVKDKAEVIEGTHSISITYPANNGGQLEELELTQSLGIDHVLAKRDQLRLLIYISNPSQLNTEQGSISLGRNTDEDNGGKSPLSGIAKDTVNMFKWPLSELPVLGYGWNEVFLPFTDNFRIGRPKFEEDDLLEIESGDLSGRSRMRWFKFSFAGVEDNEQFDVKLAGISIVRALYVPGHFGNALYLAGNEYAKLPLYNFNVFEGTIEFFLNPDWNKDPGCHTCEDAKDHTLFRIFNVDGFVFGAFMTGHGLRIYLNNGATHTFLTDNSSARLQAGRNHHVAITWDWLGKKSSNAILVYIDNVLSSSFPAEAIDSSVLSPNPDATLLLGGYAWGGVTERRISSIDGAIENIKIFNFAKTNFSSSIENQGLEVIRPSDDLIEISLDGINYYGSNDRGSFLPLLRRNVGPHQEFNVFIRRKGLATDVPDRGQERTAYIEVLRAMPG